MKDVEELVKDKAVFYWLDVEISMMHIYLYWIGAVVVNRLWGWVAAGMLTLVSLTYMARVAKKMLELKSNHKRG